MFALIGFGGMKRCPISKWRPFCFRNSGNSKDSRNYWTRGMHL